MILTQLHRLAHDDLQRAVRHFNTRDVGLADRFLDAVAEARSRIRDNPLGGAPYPYDCRFVKTKRYRYVLYYRFNAETEIAVIFAVAHASRKPGYWLRRTRRP